MVAKEQVTGARLVGPVGSAEQVLLTFRYSGTPTFVSVDRNGRVVRTLPGYPVRPEMERWFAVMVGDAEVP
jgi:thioredoxin-related protein